MTNLSDFNLSELGIFIGVCSSALAALLLASQKSKCKTINLCCLKCERDTELIKFEDKLEKGIPPTPKPKEEKLELIKEPEIEEP